MPDVIEELLKWSTTLRPWQRDSLRRLAASDVLTPEEENEVLRILKAEHGIKFETDPPEPMPLLAEHLHAGNSIEVRLKAIANIHNVNQLVENSRLDFASNGLITIYGDNGAGKSGFIRILRNACRSRIWSANGKAVPILSNIYGSTANGPAMADICVLIDRSDRILTWRDGEPPPSDLAHIAVFDSQAAALYVDESNHIAFLPYNLDLFFKLNRLCVSLKTRLEKDQRDLKALLTPMLCEIDSTTEAGQFLVKLSDKTTREDVEAAVRWTDQDKMRSEELVRLLDNPASAAADLASLAAWIKALIDVIAPLEAALIEESVFCLRKIQVEAGAAREAANALADGTFAGDHLPGVGTETWRRMYQAARDYSVTEAYLGRPFPVVDEGARCVLCQQELDAAGVGRLSSFESYVSGKVARDAESADAAEQFARQAFEMLAIQLPIDYEARLAQLEQRNARVSAALRHWMIAAEARHKAVVKAAGNGQWTSLPAMPTSVLPMLKAVAAGLQEAATVLTTGLQGDQKEALQAEQRELKAREQLSLIRNSILRRIEELKLEAALRNCIQATSTTGITRRAGEFSEKYLTPQVKELLEEEVKELNIGHLRPTLLRKSDNKSAQFKVELQPALKCRTSDVLSEGEHRALALASFLTEARSMSETATIIIDDPVSSLDHGRSILVAKRLVQESRRRQVIVFTHNLMFLHHLMQEAEEIGLEPKCVGIFRNADGTGHIDPSGVPWAGKPVAKRVKRLENDLAQVKKLANASPENYCLQVKALYGRMRDCWERLVEEKVFNGVVTRFNQKIQTQKLRYVEVGDKVYERIEAGMTRTSTYSHDNPAAGTAPVPGPQDVAADLQELVTVIQLIVDDANKVTEQRRKGARKE